MLGRNIGKHVVNVHVEGEKRMCEGKGCRCKAMEGSRWCTPTVGDHVAPVWANREAFQVGV